MMIKLTFLLLFWCHSSGSILLSQLDDSYLGVSLSRCIFTVGKNFFDPTKDIINLGDNKARFVFNSRKHFTFYSADLNFLPRIFHCYDKNYLLEVDGYKEASYVFRIIKQQNCWNPNQRIFLYSSVFSANQTLEFSRMINLTHTQKLNNVVVMLPSKNKQHNFNIYRWASEDSETCLGKTRYPNFFTCRFGNISAFRKQHIGPSICTLKVKAVVWPPFVLYKGQNKQSDHITVKKGLIGGIEIELMNLISHLLGITVEYFISMKEDWGRSYFNGSTTKSMEDLTTRKVDIAFGSLTVTLSRYLLFGSSIPYIEETLLCCVPYDGHFDMWSSFFDVSSLHIYFLISLIYVFITSAIWMTAKFNKKEFQIYNKDTLFLYVFAAILGNSVSVLPRTRRVRMLFLMLIIFELFYVAFYQSLLTSILSTQKFKQEIRTMEDVLDRNMNIYNQPENHRYLEFQQDERKRKINERWVNCENTTKCLENLYKTKRGAICLGKYYKDYILQNSVREGQAPLYCFNQKIISYPVVMIMRKSLPFRKKMDEIIGRAVSSGLVNKWTSALFYNSTKGSIPTPKVIFGILGFSHLRPVFCVYSIGLSFACAVLLLEKLYHSLLERGFFHN